MVLNKDPKVGAARDFAKKFRQTHTVILFMNEGDETIGYASYGKNEKMCKEAQRIADIAYRAVLTYLGNR